MKHQKRPLVILGRAPVDLTRAPVNLNRNKRRRKRTRRRSRRKQVLPLVLTGKVKPPAWETLKASFFFPLNVSVSRCSPILQSLPFLAWLINRCVFVRGSRVVVNNKYDYCWPASVSEFSRRCISSVCFYLLFSIPPDAMKLDARVLFL